jgi:acyl carrier protein
VATSVTKEQVQERISEAIASFGPAREQVVPEATWGQLGLDSLHLVELADIASEEYGAEIKGEDFEEVSTVGEAVDLIYARAQ